MHAGKITKLASQIYLRANLGQLALFRDNTVYAVGVQGYTIYGKLAYNLT